MIEILFAAGDLLVVNKLSGVMVHRGEGVRGPVLMTQLRDQVGARVYPLHRLDRATSGCIAFALSPTLVPQFQQLLETGQVKKQYLALVRGVAPDAGMVDHPIPRREDGPRVASQTAYRRVATFEGRYSLVLCWPLTGRRHQIRRHMKHLSLPLIGDVNYGKGDHNRRFRREFALNRLALHALSLSFPDPAGGGNVRVIAPLPNDLRAPLERMGFVLDLQALALTEMPAA